MMQGEMKSFGTRLLLWREGGGGYPCEECASQLREVRNNVLTRHTFEGGLIKFRSMFRN